MSEDLKTLQNAVLTRLEEDSALSNVPVLALHAGSLENLIARNSSGAEGLLVIIMPPLPERASEAPGLVFEDVSLTLRIRAHLHVDDSLPDMMSLAQIISERLQDWNPALMHWHGRLRLRTQRPWTLSLGERAPQPHQLDMHFTLCANLSPIS